MRHHKNFQWSMVLLLGVLLTGIGAFGREMMSAPSGTLPPLPNGTARIAPVPGTGSGNGTNQPGTKVFERYGFIETSQTKPTSYQ
jgi:hypothetical protein